MKNDALGDKAKATKNLPALLRRRLAMVRFNETQIAFSTNRNFNNKNNNVFH